MLHKNKLTQNNLDSSQHDLPKVKDVIVEIGYTGCRICFLNWSIEDAKKKYMEIEELNEWDESIHISEITIKDGIFRAYDIYEHL